MSLNTYGLTPMTFWKFWEIDGWQVLAYVTENEDDDARSDLVVETAIDDLGERSSAKFSGTHAVIEKLFEALTDGHQALQGLLDQLGPILERAK